MLLYVCSVTSAVSDSVRPYGLWPASLLCPWHFSGKNTGVGCHDTFPPQGSNLSPCCLLVLVGGFFTTGATWETTCCFLRSCCCSALPLHIPHIRQCQLSTPPCSGRWLPTPAPVCGLAGLWFCVLPAPRLAALAPWLSSHPHRSPWLPVDPCLQSCWFSQAHGLGALHSLAPPSHPPAPCCLSLGSLGHSWCPA